MACPKRPNRFLAQKNVSYTSIEIIVATLLFLGVHFIIILFSWRGELVIVSYIYNLQITHHAYCKWIYLHIYIYIVENGSIWKDQISNFFSIHFLQAASDFIRLVRPRPIDCDSGSEHTMKGFRFPVMSSMIWGPKICNNCFVRSGAIWELSIHPKTSPYSRFFVSLVRGHFLCSDKRSACFYCFLGKVSFCEYLKV